MTHHIKIHLNVNDFLLNVLTPTFTLIIQLLHIPVRHFLASLYKIN